MAQHGAEVATDTLPQVATSYTSLLILDMVALLAIALLRLGVRARGGLRQQRRALAIENLVEFHPHHPDIIVHAHVDHMARYFLDLYPRVALDLEREHGVFTLGYGLGAI